MSVHVTGGGVLGVDTGTRTLREADNLLTDLVSRLGLPAGALACTHLIRTWTPHVAVSLSIPEPVDLAVLPEDAGVVLGDHRAGPAALEDGAAYAAAEHTRSGRAVGYPGVEHLVATMTVEEILAGSAIDRIEVLMGTEPEPGQQVVTRDFVRPTWQDGTLVLLTMPAAKGMLVPYEVPDPTPCCADHT